MGQRSGADKQAEQRAAVRDAILPPAWAKDLSPLDVSSVVASIERAGALNGAMTLLLHAMKTNPPICGCCFALRRELEGVLRAAGWLAVGENP